MKAKKEIRQDFILMIIILALTFVVIKYIGQRTVVKGTSMLPTLQNQDSLILDKVSYRFAKPERFDIIVFPGDLDEAGHKKMYIKRIVGLPGEKVEIKNDSVFINGKRIKGDQYGAGVTISDTEYSKVTLKENQYYCLGDNRENSEDSRLIGPITLNRKHLTNPDLYEINGIIRARIFPFHKMRGL